MAKSSKIARRWRRLRDNLDLIVGQIMSCSIGIAIIGVVIGIVTCIIWFVLVLWNKITAFGANMLTWNVVILAAIVAGSFSLLRLFIGKWLDAKIEKKKYLFEKRVKTYEDIVAFIFKYQRREGYGVTINMSDAQSACFSVNQQVMLWGSRPVQRAWIKYLVKSWQRNNCSYQMNAVSLFEQIAKELGQRFDKGDGPLCPPSLRLLYDTRYITVQAPIPPEKKEVGIRKAKIKFARKLPIR